MNNFLKTNSSHCLDSFPTGLMLALNKARTISWRLGVAWSLVSKRGDVLVCNGCLFNQHNELLTRDLKKYRKACKLFISYCPLNEDLNSGVLLSALRMSKLVEINVFSNDVVRESISNLFKETAIPVFRWTSHNINCEQEAGIDWVRRNRRPWVHVICSNSLGGGAYPLVKMYEKLGVTPYIALKGLESSLLLVQNECGSKFDSNFSIANPQYFGYCRELVNQLLALASENTSVVTVVCDTDWLAQLIRMGLANEVSYFLSLRSTTRYSSAPQPIIEFPIDDQWKINSSDVMGDFMQVKLQRK